MKPTLVINCIRTSERNGVRNITHVGGCYRSGERWLLTEREAIAKIESRACDFGLYREETLFGVSVGEAKGRKWLRSLHSLATLDFLFELPECTQDSSLIPSPAPEWRNHRGSRIG